MPCDNFRFVSQYCQTCTICYLVYFACPYKYKIMHPTTIFAISLKINKQKFSKQLD